VRIGNQTPPVATQAQKTSAGKGETSSVAPTDKVSLLDKMEALNNKPATITNVLRNAAVSAGFGALTGQFIDSHQGRSVGLNAFAAAGVGGVIVGLPTALFTGLATSDSSKALKYGAIGFAGGAAAGGVLGAVAGQVNYLLNHALPWSPAINGAVLGGGFSLASGVTSLVRQAHKEHQAQNAKNTENSQG
jgi:hypothetical protein